MNNAATDLRASNFQASGLRQKVDQLMDILYSGGVNNPMDSIEQISYLLFQRMLWENDELAASLFRQHRRTFSGDWARYGWGNFVTLTGDELFDALRAAVEKLHELPGLSPTGRLLFERATLEVYDRPTLRALVQGVQEIDLEAHNGGDPKGDMYEYLLSKLSTAGTNGQFRTPRHIIAMMVQMVDPRPGQRICDPACGTAGFLIAAFNHILRSHTSPAELERGRLAGDLLATGQTKFLYEQAFTGFDNDANMVKLAIMNLYLHKLEKADIDFRNPLTTKVGGSYPGPQYDVVLANPPFSGAVQKESIVTDLNHGLNTRATELLFLKWFIDHLAPGGRASVIVPAGVLFGSTKAARRVRELLLTECDLQAVVNLPSGVFKPYSGVSTAALIFHRPTTKPKQGMATDSVWFYDLTADGFSLDDKRTPVAANDIPDALVKWPGREEGPNSYCVPLERIVENDLSLAGGRYKPVAVTEANHEHPRQIFGRGGRCGERDREARPRLAPEDQHMKPEWPLTPLGQVLVGAQGGFAEGRRDPAGVIQLRMNNVNTDGALNWDALVRVPATSEAVGFYRLVPGDVVFNNTNSTELVGKTALFPGYREDVLFSNHFTRLRTQADRLAPGFLARWLQLQWFEGLFARLCNRWVGQSAFPREKLLVLTIPLPPVEEQERILRLLDAADELRRLRAQADRRTATLVPAIFHEMFGDPVTNPMGWECYPLKTFSSSRLGKILDAKQQTGNHLRRYLKNANVQWDRFELDDLSEMDFTETEREMFRLRLGDVLICEGGEIGRAAMWRDELTECYFQKALHRVRPHPDQMVPEYLVYLFWALAKSKAFDKIVGSATIVHLTGVQLSNLLVPLPPLALQQEFAQRVAEVRALEAQQAASRERLEALFQSLLHRAFAGEL